MVHITKAAVKLNTRLAKQALRAQRSQERGPIVQRRRWNPQFLSTSRQPDDPRWKRESRAPRSHTISRLGRERGGVAGEGQLWCIRYLLGGRTWGGTQGIASCVPIFCHPFRSRHSEGLRSLLNTPKTGAWSPSVQRARGASATAVDWKPPCRQPWQLSALPLLQTALNT